MKQSSKYGLLVVLLWLLHSVAMKAVDFPVSASANLVQEECFLSQARPVRNAFQRFYIYYSEMPCEVSHADASHIPIDKGSVRFAPCFREHKARNNHYSNNQLHSTTHAPSDPISYYVFGLRKILV